MTEVINISETKIALFVFFPALITVMMMMMRAESDAFPLKSGNKSS